MTGLWIGLGVFGAALVWLGWQVWTAPLLPGEYSDLHDVWGCEECEQQAAEEAAEVAALEAMWEAS